MNKETSYTQSAGLQHIRALGQYFTEPAIADFMCSWAGEHAETMLDPAAGNSVFLSSVRSLRPRCALTGYEIDGKILAYFGNPADARLKNENYLLNGWEDRYDAIVCNPPYHRFQDIPDRESIIAAIRAHTGIRCSSYTNLYILFLIKSIFELSDHGRLAYLLPSEFLNSGYGTAVKQLMLEKHLLRAVLNFENDRDIFQNATTTCCILLLDHEPKTGVSFFSIASVRELTDYSRLEASGKAVFVKYTELKAEEKWRPYLIRESIPCYKNLCPVSRYCTVSRGIATGANDFFCFSRSKAEALGIPKHCLTECICHSADVRSPVFQASDFEALAAADKTVFLLNGADREALASYIAGGEEAGISRKYLPAHRSPWYAPEQKEPAPIWVASACRKGMKFVRNEAMVRSLTTFHSVCVRSSLAEDANLVFCYFLTPAAQEILRRNRKVLGSGLEKFQPNDLNSAEMLELGILSPADRKTILRIYDALKIHPSQELISRLNDLFSSYLK